MKDTSRNKKKENTSLQYKKNIIYISIFDKNINKHSFITLVVCMNTNKKSPSKLTI